jgi:hypothetical protein
LVAVLYFLMLTNDYMALYAMHMFSPTYWVQAVLFDPLPIKIRPFDLVLAIVLFLSMGKRDARGPRVRPMRSMQFLAAGTTVVWFLLGIARSGGDVRAASWQIYLVLATILASFTVASTFRTPEHFVLLVKAYVAAGFYRAFMCVLFYALYVHTMVLFPPPPEMTIHDDSVLWVVVIMVLVINATESRSRSAALYAALGIPFLMLAIQLNNRRLAWVSLIGSLVAFYALLRPSSSKRRITRGVLYVAPVILAYVAVGWGKSEGIFKPLAAFSSVSTVEDASTKARNVENLGLIATAWQGWFTGTGWGHKYVEVSNKYSIANLFELWQYVPHNSVLGLFAYTGFLGFLGIWLRVPTAVFVLARTARLAERSIERSAGILGVVTIAICGNQTYGDMGMFMPVTMYTFALAFAAAMRIPSETVAWPATSRRTANRGET